MSELAAELRQQLRQRGRLLSKNEIEDVVGVLDEFLKPSERRDGPGEHDPEWFYLEYRRAKSVEHALLKERSTRRKMAKRHSAEQMADTILELKGILERLVGAIRARAERDRMMPPELAGPFTEALAAIGGAHAGHLEMEALLRQLMADAAYRVCRGFAEHLADKSKEQPMIPPAAREPLAQWRKLYLQFISAEQHRTENSRHA